MELLGVSFKVRPCGCAAARPGQSGFMSQPGLLGVLSEDVYVG